MLSEQAEETFDRGTSSGGGRGARFRTRRKLSKNEEKNLNDMVQEMALFVDHMICDGNKNLG